MGNATNQKPDEDAAKSDGSHQDTSPVKRELLRLLAGVAKQGKGRSQGAVHTQCRNHGECASVNAVFGAAQQPRQQDEIDSLTDDGKTLSRKNP